MAICKDLKNLGASACRNPMQIAKRLIFVPLLGSDAAVNEIATAAGVTKSALQAYFDGAHKLDRFYPTPLLENVENTRGETMFHEFDSGAKLKVKEGVKHFIGHLPAEHPLLLEGLKSFEGQNFGIYIIDADGNFIYQTDASTKLKVKPFEVDGNSFVATYIEPTSKEVAMVKIEFDYMANTKDELMRFIASDDLDFNGLSTVDVYSLWTVTWALTTGVDQCTLVAETEYGVPVTGLLKTTNITASGGTIGDIVETSDGHYTIPFTGLSGTTTITITITKPLYDFGAAKSVSVTHA